MSVHVCLSMCLYMCIRLCVFVCIMCMYICICVCVLLETEPRTLYTVDKSSTSEQIPRFPYSLCCGKTQITYNLLSKPCLTCSFTDAFNTQIMDVTSIPTPLPCTACCVSDCLHLCTLPQSCSCSSALYGWGHRSGATQ